MPDAKQAGNLLDRQQMSAHCKPRSAVQTTLLRKLSTKQGCRDIPPLRKMTPENPAIMMLDMLSRSQKFLEDAGNTTMDEATAGTLADAVYINMASGNDLASKHQGNDVYIRSRVPTSSVLTSLLPQRKLAWNKVSHVTQCLHRCIGAGF